MSTVVSKTLARLAKVEGKKHQMTMGDAREFTSLIAAEMVSNVQFHIELLKVGYKKNLKFKRRPDA